MPRATDVRARLAGRGGVLALAGGGRRLPPLADFWARVSRSGASPRRRASQTGVVTPCSRPTPSRTASTRWLTHGTFSWSAPGQAGQAQGRALHRDGGVAAGEVDHRPAGPAGQACGPAGRSRGRGRGGGARVKTRRQSTKAARSICGGHGPWRQDLSAAVPVARGTDAGVIPSRTRERGSVGQGGRRGRTSGRPSSPECRERPRPRRWPAAPTPSTPPPSSRAAA